MDHMIDKIQTYLDLTIEQVAEERRSGEYAKLSDCPHYGEAKALVEAIHVLERYAYGASQTEPVKDLVAEV